MSKIIEVEMRGPLKKENLQNLIKIILGEGQFIERKERVLIDYSGSLKDGGIENRNIDVRLRNTNKISEIIIKTGNWGGSDVRREFSVKSANPFDDLVQVYRLLGLNQGVLCVRNIDVYKYKNIELAIVEVPNHSYFFEAEIELEETEGIEKAQSKLKEVLKNLELNTYSDTEYFEYIEKLNKEANTIFDSNLESETYFKDTFGI